MKNIFFGLLAIGLIIGIMFLTFQIIYIPGTGDDNNFPPHSYFSFDNEDGYGLLNFKAQDNLTRYKVLKRYDNTDEKQVCRAFKNFRSKI